MTNNDDNTELNVLDSVITNFTKKYSIWISVQTNLWFVLR